MARELPNWVEAYLHYTRHDEAPEIFHLWTAITVLSAAVNRNCWMSRAYYRCYPNLYTLFVGPSGIGKSSAAGIGVELMMETSVCQNVYKDSLTPPALLQRMSDPTSRVSYEVGGKLLEKTPLFIFASELGNLLSQRGSIKELTMLLTELFNKQGDHEDTTNVRGIIRIIKPIVTFFGCCPPKFIEEELPTSTMRSGFLGRMLVTKASAKRYHNPEPRFTPDDIELRAKLKSDLELIATLHGEFVFDDETYDKWVKWYTAQPLDFTHMDSDVEGFAARKAQFVQRVAMLLTIAKRNDMTIRDEEFVEAVRLVGKCEKASSSLAIQDKVSQLAEYVLGTLIRHTIKTGRSAMTKTELMRAVSRRVNAKLLSEILDQLVVENRIGIHGTAIMAKEGLDIAKALSRKERKVKDAAKGLEGKIALGSAGGEEKVDS